MSQSPSIKVAVLHNIIAPYIVPVFNRLSKLDNIKLKVFFYDKTANNRIWRVPEDIWFDYKVIPSFVVELQSRNNDPLWLSPTALSELIKGKFDVVISTGHESLGTYLGLIYSKLWCKPLIFRSESTANEQSWRRKLSLPLLKILARHSNACITTGSRAKDYLIHLGVAPQKVSVVYDNVVDVMYYQQVSSLNEEEKIKIKTRLGLASSQIILYVGQLIERKGLKDLLSAFACLQTKGIDAKLLIVGYGPQEEELKSFCTQKRLKGVSFLGGKNKEELLVYYAIADVFVLPSLSEVWGLVINEAMACGLPVITTRNVGASADLVKDGINGFVVPSQDEQALFEVLREILKNNSLREKMGVASLEIIKKFTFFNAALGWGTAIRKVTSAS